MYSLVQAITRLGEARAKAAEEAQIPNLERFQAGNYVMISTFAKVAIYINNVSRSWIMWRQGKILHQFASCWKTQDNFKDRYLSITNGMAAVPIE